ncbi:MAG: sigma 54-interacting transcriptional regulator [Pseudomonadota bacterium]
MKPIFDEYFKWLLETKKINIKSIEQYKKRLEVFFEHKDPSKEIADLTAEDLNSILDNIKNSGYSIRTINQCISSIKSLYNFLSTTYNYKNLAKAIKTKKVDKIESISDDNISVFLNKIENIADNRKSVFLLFILFGLSIEQISKLKKADITVEENRVTINLEKSVEYFVIASNSWKKRIESELIKLKENAKRYLFETSKQTHLSKPHFNYIFKSFQKYIPEECSSILKLRSEKLKILTEREYAEKELKEAEKFSLNNIKDTIVLTKPTFSGRDEEIDELQTNYIQQKNSEKKLCLFSINGETGIGKRTLIDEFVKLNSKDMIPVYRLIISEAEPIDDIINFISSYKKISYKESSLITDSSYARRSAFLKKLVADVNKIHRQNDSIVIIENCNFLKHDSYLFLKLYFKELELLENKMFMLLTFNTDKEKINSFKRLIKERFPQSGTSQHINLKRTDIETQNKIIDTASNYKVSNELIQFLNRYSKGNPGYALTLIADLKAKNILKVINKTICLNSKINYELPSSLIEIKKTKIQTLYQIQRLILYIIASSNISITNLLILNILKRYNPLINENEIIDGIKLLGDLNLIKENKKDEYIIEDKEIFEPLKTFLDKNQTRKIHKHFAMELEENPTHSNVYQENIAYHFLQAGINDKAIEYYNKVANFYFQNGLWEKAVNLYETILMASNTLAYDERNKIKKHCYLKISDFHLKVGDFIKAEKNFLLLNDYIESDLERINLQKNLCQIKINKGQINEGNELIDRTIKEIEEYEDHLETKIDLMFLKITSFINVTKYTEAKVLIDSIKKIQAVGAGQKRILHNLNGLVEFYTGNYEKAKDEFLVSLNLAEKINDVPGLMKAFNHIGLAYYQLENFEAAIQWHESALKKAEEVSDIFGKAQMLQNIGNCYLRQGNYLNALKKYKESNTIYQDLGSPSGAEISLFNLGLIYSETGDMENAHFFASEAQNLAMQRKNFHLLASCYSLLGDIYQFKNDYLNALKSYEKASELLKKVSRNIELGITILNIATCKINLGALDQIEDYLEEARNVSNQDRKIIIESNTIALKIALKHNDLDSAEKIANRIENLEAEDTNFQILLRYYEVLGNYYLKKNNKEKYKYYYEKINSQIRSTQKYIPATLKLPFMILPTLQDAFSFMNQVKITDEELDESEVLARIMRITTNISSNQTDDNNLNLIISNALLFGKGSYASVILINPKGFSQSVSSSIDKLTERELSPKLIEAIIYQACQDDNTVCLKDILEIIKQNPIDSIKHIQDFLATPIVFEQKIIGILYIENPKIDISLTKNVDKINILAGLAATIIGKSKTNELKASDAPEGIKAQLSFEPLEKEENEALEITDPKRVFSKIITTSPKMFSIFDTIEKTIDSDIPILITGESGTGKELIAKAIHNASTRANKPFFAENCGAITETILESELFGYVKGSFTDAIRDKKGIFEQAEGGTLFLDEIGEMSLNMQKKLLRVLQEKEIRRVGSDRTQKIDVRIITATHRNLTQLVKNEAFRQDFYFRINAIELNIPPLRERTEDIPLLVDHFINKSEKPKKISKKLLKYFSNYDWPGNIRELENEVNKLIVLSDDEIIDESLIEYNKKFETIEQITQSKRLDEIEKIAIINAIKETKGNKSKTAEMLGVTRNTLNKKLAKYKIKPYLTN